MFNTNHDNLATNTTHRVVAPFYLYAALSFLMATILLFFSTPAFTHHYFHPRILAITHTMGLGWGTMVILGASHQLVPVLIEGRLYSNALAYFSFVAAAAGIPLLVYGFYVFNIGWPAQWGAILVNAAILIYLYNLAASIVKSKKENVHAVFVFTAVLWLLLTTLLGLALVYNFSSTILSKDSLLYLPLHAHMGMIGWFLLLIMGIGSRLIPMFLISKYSNTKMLWSIYFLVNAGLVTFVIFFLYFPQTSFYFLPVASILVAIILFGIYCYRSFKVRIRRQIDEQLKLSLLSVILMLFPVILLFIIIGGLLVNPVNPKMILVYGFIVFFGWITSMIFGMTFKTLPFIVWNKIYSLKAGLGKTPNPKDLFSSVVFRRMMIFYLVGFILFIIGIYQGSDLILKFATLFLFIGAVLYNLNVMKILSHKPLSL